MNDHQRRRCEILRTALNAVHRQLDEGLTHAEAYALALQCDVVEEFTRDNPTLIARAWHRAAIATRPLLFREGYDEANPKHREQWNQFRDEWIAAYAELPPMDLPEAGEQQTT